MCVMSEPGPNHSLTPAAQAEMRSFRVIERDVDVGQIAVQAKEVGFDHIDVGIFCSFPWFVQPTIFEEAMNPASPFPGDVVRWFLGNHRLVRLHKGGAPDVDSRRRDALHGQLGVAILGRHHQRHRPKPGSSRLASGAGPAR